MKKATALILATLVLLPGTGHSQHQTPYSSGERLRRSGFSSSVSDIAAGGAVYGHPGTLAAGQIGSQNHPPLPAATRMAHGERLAPGARAAPGGRVRDAGYVPISGHVSTGRVMASRNVLPPISAPESFSRPGREPQLPPISQGHAPVVRSLPPPPGAPPVGEIFSRGPLNLPPVSSLQLPSRLTLPPISRDPIMYIPFGEAVSRILGCNFTGLTGLIHTTSADVSRMGSFKMGFHSNWFKLDRVYDRVLASGESGEIFEVPLFFNYAVTDDLEFAFMLPVINYTIRSRILWTRDFRESGVGDTKFSFKYKVFDNPEYQMRGAFGLGFKFPTGSDQKGLGTGKTDFEVFTAFSKNFERVIAHLNLGYVMTGDPNTQFYPDGLSDIFYYNIGIEYPHHDNVTVMAEVNGQDWGAEGLKIDVVPGLRYTPTDSFAFEVGVPIAVTNDQRYGYNYRLVLGVTAFFK